MRGIERMFEPSRRTLSAWLKEQANDLFSDYWSAYQAAIPSWQHRSVGKETGETAHIERWNNTLR